jgi:hypothetical protein
MQTQKNVRKEQDFGVKANICKLTEKHGKKEKIANRFTKS